MKWVSIGKDIGFIALATGERLYIAFGDPSKVRAVEGALNPRQLDALPYVHQIAATKLVSVRWQDDEACVKFNYIDDTTNEQAETAYQGTSKADARDVAREIAEYYNLGKKTSRPGQVDHFNVWLYGVMILAVAGIGYVALGLEGDDVGDMPNSRRARGMKVIAEFLGPNGLIVVMVLTVLAMVGRIVHKKINPPTEFVYGRG